MPKKNQKKQRLSADDTAQLDLPPGVKLWRSDETQGTVSGLAFDPRGELLASASDDGTVKLWQVRDGKLLRTLEAHEGSVVYLVFDSQGDLLASANNRTVTIWEARSGKLLRTLEGHTDTVRGLAFDPQGNTLASASDDNTVKLWDARSGKLLRTLEGHRNLVLSLVFNPRGDMLASGSADRTVKFWETPSGKLLRTLEGHHSIVSSLAFNPEGDTLVSGGFDSSLNLWEVPGGKLLRNLEGHHRAIHYLRFSPNGRILFSKSQDHTIRLWSCETWETVAVIPAPALGPCLPALTFHPVLPLLATPDASSNDGAWLIHLLELDYNVLLGKRTNESAANRAVHHTTGKIVLLGDHSVGKSALGHRLIHGAFKEQASTHGQQFWVFPALGKHREDGTQCEAILWDFAGQPDYRLVHALFVDNADLGLVLFDASDIHDPLHGVGFWLKQLQTIQSRCPIILVAAQTDRGTSPLTAEELSAFCQSHGIEDLIATSAFTGTGINELIERMKSLIAWEDKAATVTTTTFKRIKDYVLNLKETESQRQTIVTPEELRARLQATDTEWHFLDDEMLTAVGHLENYGYVKRLHTSKGELRILLQPERLNNLASSFVLEARRNPKGLGALEEKRLLAGGYDFPELKDLDHAERDILLDSAALLFGAQRLFPRDRPFAHRAIPGLP